MKCPPKVRHKAFEGHFICYPYKKDKKPGLSQARALIFPKDLVSLSNSISYNKDTL